MGRVTTRAMSPSVYLRRISSYDPGPLLRAVGELLDGCCPRPAPGDTVLVKPNLVGKRNARLSTTRPEVAGAVCAWLLDLGVRPVVADSPAFGSAASVARASGLDKEMEGLGLILEELDRPRPLAVSFGTSIGVSTKVLEAHLILNLPKVKAHNQMRFTCAVKNLFGTAVGCRKALAHALHGEKENRFESVIVEIMESLPRTISLADGIEAMDRAGPMGGDPFPLELLGASANPVALDTALCSLVGLAPEEVPLWRECLGRGLPGADPTSLVYPLEGAGAFDAREFRTPEKLSPVTFRPIRLLKGRIKSLVQRLG